MGLSACRQAGKNEPFPTLGALARVGGGRILIFGLK